MAIITGEQIKRIYAYGSALGILESGNKEDNLHSLVFRITEKNSISQLTQKEFDLVQAELLDLMKLSNHKTPLKTDKKKKRNGASVPGYITPEQKSKCWRLIYRLIELDTTESSTTAGERMCGAIKKILNISANVKDPFAWVNFNQAHILIEALKKFVVSAEKKAGVCKQ